VGFQTKLKYGEQGRVFRKIPALAKAEFLRLGSIHRNTFVCGPKVLRPDLSLKGRPLVYLAGQITGVEGYLESAACGLLAAVFVLQRLRGAPHAPPPPDTALGSLLRHVISGNEKNFQPANMHFGLFDPLFFENAGSLKRDALRETMLRQGAESAQRWKKEVDLLHGDRT
jgi:methylenetetrahydrofolate--tRNA-(uracil-5-)-methyltransferase